MDQVDSSVNRNRWAMIELHRPIIEVLAELLLHLMRLPHQVSGQQSASGFRAGADVFRPHAGLDDGAFATTPSPAVHLAHFGQHAGPGREVSELHRIPYFPNALHNKHL